MTFTLNQRVRHIASGLTVTIIGMFGAGAHQESFLIVLDSGQVLDGHIVPFADIEAL